MGLAAIGDSVDARRTFAVAPRRRAAGSTSRRSSRSDFPTETIAAIAKRRRVLLDGQGLVRAPKLGPLELDAEYDPEVLRHVWALKLSEEEAVVLGDPKELPVREVLLTHGSRGVTLIAGGRETEIRDARRLRRRTRPAPGDAFSVAYAVARSSGTPPVGAAQQAAALVAALLGSR